MAKEQEKEKELVRQEKKEIKKPAEEMRPGPVFIPAVDILENENEIFILADMPGVESKNIDIDLRDNLLTLRGKISPVEEEKEKVLYREFNWGDYFRQFTVTDAINQGKISAKIDNGVLQLTLPKAEKKKPKKIQVAAG